MYNLIHLAIAIFFVFGEDGYKIKSPLYQPLAVINNEFCRNLEQNCINSAEKHRN